MIKRSQVEALVLSRRSIGEADRLLTLFTRDHGLVRAVAKGVRKIPSRRGGHLEPLTKVWTLLQGAGSGLYVGHAETLNYYEGLLRQGSGAWEAAHAMAVVVPRLFAEEEPHVHFFHAMDHAWHMLAQVSVEKQMILEATILFLALKVSGLLPELGHCGECGRAAPEEAVVLDAVQGGWKCLTCHSGFEGTAESLSPQLFKVLRFIVSKPELALRIRMTYEDASQLHMAVRQYVSQAVAAPVLLKHHA